MRRGIMVALGTAAIFVGPSAGAAWADFVCPVLPISEQGKQHGKANFITISGDVNRSASLWALDLAGEVKGSCRRRRVSVRKQSDGLVGASHLDVDPPT